MVPASRVALCLLAACTAALCQKAASPSEYAWVGGTVFDRGTGSPLSKALVTLSTEEETPLDAQAITDGTGRFGFTDIPPGRYQLHADCKGYLHAWYGAETVNHAPGIITLHGGERRDFVLRLEALGAVSGTVVDAEGDALPGVAVSLWMQSFWRGKPRFFERSSVNSDDRGVYRISNVVAGRYIALANGLGRQAFRMQPEAIADQKAPEQARYGAQFFPGTDRMSLAAVITVDPGKEIKGTDFRMSPYSTATLRGTVTPPVELPADARIDVVIMQQDLPDENQGTFAFSVPGPNYSFEQYGLVPGEYLLLTRLSLGERRYQGAQRVEIKGGVDKEVMLKLDPGIDLSGSLKVEGDDPGQREYKVELSPGDALSPNEPRPMATVKADSSFVLKSVAPGIWDIGVNPIPPGGYIKSMRLGDQDVVTEDMIIGPKTAAPLRIVVSTRGGVLEGSVTRTSGEHAARSIVLLAPAGKFSQILSFYSTAVADEAGLFKFKALTPGSYKLYAFEAMESGAWQNPEFLKPFDSYGEKVAITEGVNAPKDVQLIPGARSQQ
ncbi:MAG: carboxypeptidase-like regulatory domain-containing protein [Acidobacteriia bacterium]|nr:carboxypeptidase-like regulatory domain-containing protein [Terriglobia bacterium]